MPTTHAQRRIDEVLGRVRESGTLKPGMYVTVNVKKFKDRGYGNQAKILSTMLRHGHGTAYVVSVSRDESEAEIAGSEMDAMLGTLTVPTAILTDTGEIGE